MSWMMKAHERRAFVQQAKYMIAVLDHIEKCKEKIRENRNKIRSSHDEEEKKWCQVSIDVAEEDIREWKMEYTVHFNTMKSQLLEWSDGDKHEQNKECKVSGDEA